MKRGGKMYIKKTWIEGDDVTPIEMNNIEDGIETVDLSLTAHKAERATLTELAHVNHGTLTTTLDTIWAGTVAPFSKAQTVTGILASDTPIIDIVMSGTFVTDEARAEAWGYIYRAVTSANTITFHAMEKPAVALPLQIRVVR
jgi:hypothetical protein